MPTTRSHASGTTTTDAKSAASKDTSGTKRKAADSDSAPAKKPKKQPTKQAKIEPETGNIDTEVDGANEADSKTISINRAPVLELWAACITQTLHPDLAWPTCLSCGSAISTLAAISKGRAIGKIDETEKSEQDIKKQQRQKEEQELEEVRVMTFHLKLKDGQAMVGSSPKIANEEALKKKYGGEEAYGKVKDAMMTALERWKGKEEELNKRGFHMYEDFRPNVAKGQKGWGRKGELSLKTIEVTVGK